MKKAAQFSSLARLAARCLGTVILIVASNGFAGAQGLGGPGSVNADLTPGDGLTDPMYRSDFPRNIFPAWFEWKDDLAARGFRFNLDYLALGQHSSSNLGDGKGASGLARFYGTWQPMENGSLTFKAEHRHRYTSVVPQFLGLDGGAISITGAGFNNNQWQLTNLFWSQRAQDRTWTLQAGQIDVTDFLDPYGMISNWTAFNNLSFLTNPTINAPNPGLGIAGGIMLGSNFYATGSIADANADPTHPNFDVFHDVELFKSLEFGYTSSQDRIYFDNIHVTFWHGDKAGDGTRAEDYGATFSGAWFINNAWMPFVRAGASRGTAALFNRSVSVGLGYFARNTDLFGVGLNWGTANGTSGDQFTLEAFYRFSHSSGLQVTPSIQFISNPLLNPTEQHMTVLGLRGRVVF